MEVRIVKHSIIHQTKNILDDPNTVILNKPKSLKKKLFNKKKVVSVVITSYNSSNFIKKCIDSVIKQSLGFNKVELIIVDDCSSDDTPIILKNYASEYKNISVVLLNSNTGTAAIPRNIGIELSTTDKIIFLDADDWLHNNALLSLVTEMEATNDDVVIGKTVKVDDKGESIHAEFISFKNRKSLDPFDFPYLLYYMGPQSKLIKTSVIKDNNIRFEEMKFGEDKLFLLNVYMNCSKVGAITEPVCYLNRLSSNSGSLTKVTDVIKKRKIDFQILEDVLQQQLPPNKEMMIVKRLIEYDFIKTCDSFVFVNSEKKGDLIGLTRNALSLLENRTYDIIECFDSPLYKVAAKLIKENRDEDFIKLFTWYKKDRSKKIVIKEDIPYYVVIPFEETDQYKYIPIDLLVRSRDAYIEEKEIIQTLEIYGEKVSTIESIIIRDRNRIDNEIILPLKIEGNIGEFRVNVEKLNSLNNSLFTVFVRYDGYRLANVKRIPDMNITYENREFTFYTTKVGNLGFSIKTIGYNRK